MHASTAFLFPLLLVASLQEQGGQSGQTPKRQGKHQQPPVQTAGGAMIKEAPVVPGPKKWKPFFDYVNVAAPTDEMWADLGSAKVQLDQALAAAQEAEGEVRVFKAKLETGPRGKVWSLAMFAGPATGEPKRVDLEVSQEAPKVLHRVELLSLAPGEAELWNLLKECKTSPADACITARRCAMGDAQNPSAKEAQVRSLLFLTDSTPTVWDTEVISLDKQDKTQRWGILVKSTGGARQRIAVDQYAGEPLQGVKPTELPSGLLIHDFLPGDGETLTLDSKVKAHFRLFLLDGSVVYSTTDKKRPETLVVSKAPIKGMSEGMVGMRVGGRRKIVIPYAKAFGEQGTELAPPRATVVCDVSIEELLER